MGAHDKTALGEILIEDGVITRSQFKTAMKIQEPARITGEELVNLGVISSLEFEMALELQFAELLVGLGYVDENQMFGTLRVKVDLDQRSKAIEAINDDFSDF